MTPVELSRTVLRAVRRAVDEGELSVAVPARAVVTPPGPGGSGDYATNIALQLARPAGRPPQQVAEVLRTHLCRSEGIAAVEITGPGFLNIHLDRAAVTALVRRIRGSGRGRGDQGAQGAQGAQGVQGVQRGLGLRGISEISRISRVSGISGTQNQDDLPYGHSDALAGQVVRLRVPYDIRAEVVAEALVRIVASQGGRVEIEHARLSVTEKPDRTGRLHRADELGKPGKPGMAGERDESSEPDEPVNLRPVPAPEDPTPLGPDALRWALLHPAAHDRPRITADLLMQRASNPLFRVRYAHARARALTRNAAALGFTGAPGDPQNPDDADATPMPDTLTPDTPTPATAPVTTPPDAVDTPDATTPLLTALTEYPPTLARAAAHHAPDRLARHLLVIADALLAFQHTVLPRGDEKPSAAHRDRLALAEAAGTVLAGGLSLLGIDAPEYL